MKNKKAYWRISQSDKLRPPAISDQQWEAFYADFKAECLKQGLQGQKNWRARDKLKDKMLRSRGILVLRACEPSTYIGRLYNRTRSGATSRGIEFTIRESDLHPTSRCPILDIVLDYPSLLVRGNASTPSVDRIDNAKGYVPGNVQIISHRANILKNDATLAELQALGRWASEYEKMRALLAG